MSFICQREHWASVRKSGIYYITELKLAYLLRCANRPTRGTRVVFINKGVIGEAIVDKFVHNGVRGHLVLRNIVSHVELPQEFGGLDKQATLQPTFARKKRKTVSQMPVAMTLPAETPARLLWLEVQRLLK